jgi:hypothetical protein
MTKEETRVYAKGYNAGRANRWPDHKPPMPPNELLAELMRAASEVRDEMSGLLGSFDEDDDIQKHGRGIDALDDAMTKLNAWLKDAECKGTGTTGATS